MRTLKILLQKEFRQIFRNRALLIMLFVVPSLQLLVLPLAADYEIKCLNIVIVDHDHSAFSQNLISNIVASGYFALTDCVDAFHQALNYIDSDQADLILEIPQNFEQTLIREHEQQLFIAVNAINGVKANLAGSYLNRIIANCNTDFNLKWIPISKLSPKPTIEINYMNWFNPYLKYQTFMVPGILVLLVTMIGTYMCALNIVKEKEVGTIEQLNVTPIKKYQFIVGKLIPFWIIGMLVFTIGLFLIGRIVYGLVPMGNLWLLYGYLSVYLVAVLGLGLLISTYCQSQQQAMSIVFFFMMIFILMSGLFTSIHSMPRWASPIARFSPVTYFIEVMRMIVLKGSGFKNIQYHFLIMFGFAVLLNAWAIFNYKKTH